MCATGTDQSICIWWSGGISLTTQGGANEACLHSTAWLLIQENQFISSVFHLTARKERSSVQWGKEHRFILDSIQTLLIFQVYWQFHWFSTFVSVIHFFWLNKNIRIFVTYSSFFRHHLLLIKMLYVSYH